MSKLRQELEATNYNNLKKKFTELGIESAFVAGTKKVELINIAIDVIDKLKSDSEDQEPDTDKVLQAIEDVAGDKAIEAEAAKTDFEKEVEALVAKKKFYTKESLAKRQSQLFNVFLQNNGSDKGTEAFDKSEVFKAAGKIMFN